MRGQRLASTSRALPPNNHPVVEGTASTGRDENIGQEMFEDLVAHSIILVATSAVDHPHHQRHEQLCCCPHLPTDGVCGSSMTSSTCGSFCLLMLELQSPGLASGSEQDSLAAASPATPRAKLQDGNDELGMETAQLGKNLFFSARIHMEGFCKSIDVSADAMGSRDQRGATVAQEAEQGVH